MSNATDNLLNTSEAADLLGISESWVRKMCAAGRLGRRINRTWVIDRNELRAFAKIKRLRGKPGWNPPLVKLSRGR